MSNTNCFVASYRGAASGVTKLNPSGSGISNETLPIDISDDNDTPDVRNNSTKQRVFICSLSDKSHGLNPKVVQHRVKSYGWSLEQALGLQKPPKRQVHGRKVRVDGDVYPTLKAACEAYSIAYMTVVDRESRGWSLKKALSTPVRKPRKK